MAVCGFVTLPMLAVPFIVDMLSGVHNWVGGKGVAVWFIVATTYWIIVLPRVARRDNLWLPTEQAFQEVRVARRIAKMLMMSVFPASVIYFLLVISYALTL